MLRLELSWIVNWVEIVYLRTFDVSGGVIPGCVTVEVQVVEVQVV